MRDVDSINFEMVTACGLTLVQRRTNGRTNVFVGKE